MKSHRKLFPFCCPFSRKGQTEEKFHERKELFSLRDDCEYREEYTEEEEEKERKDDAREEAVVVAETERLKSSDRPRCGPGIGVASRGYFSI